MDRINILVINKVKIERDKHKWAILFFCSSLLFISCKKEKSVSDHLSDIELAHKYCGNCHLYPEPSLLTKAAWTETLLPNMGCRLGIQTPGYDPVEGKLMVDEEFIRLNNIYPSTPLLSNDDWARILAFYSRQAPDSLNMAADTTSELKLFIAKPKGDLVARPNITALTMHQDSTVSIGLKSGFVNTFDRNWKKTDSAFIRSTPIHIGSDKLNLLGIGEMYPTEQSLGTFFTRQGQYTRPLIEFLQRPVYFVSTDLNGDQINDVLISEYGYETGRLAWYTNATGHWVQHVLYPGAGNIKTLILDFNKDGILDILSLVAQGDEHLSIYYGKNNGVFNEKRLIRFPPVYGLTDMDTLDFNKDGLMDILITNGDNADFSNILKPYHGLRLYINQGNEEFKQTIFIAYPGALQTICNDFDQDGDFDFASVSYFPGTEASPIPGFKYFNNDGLEHFSGSTFTDNNFGKWMVMDSGDLDGDGDIDLMIGSFFITMEGVTKPWDKLKKNALVFLENKTKRK